MSIDAAAIMDQQRSPGLIEVPLMQELRRLAALVPADQAIVEVGSFKGRSTAILALGASEGHGAQVHAYDPWENGTIPDGYEKAARTVPEYVLSETRQAFDEHLARVGVTDLVTAHQQPAVDGAKDYDGPKVGLLFHDGLHRLEDVRDDLKAWLPKMAATAIVVCHDIGDPNFAVLAGAEAAFTRTKALRDKWAWDGRSLHPWAKNPAKRGYVVVRTR